MKDIIRDTVLEKVKQKYDKGAAEHGGKGLAESGMNLLDYLKMLQEEQIDQMMYIEAAIKELQEKVKEIENGR